MQLEGQSADARGRIAVVEATAQEVIAGRATLPEAAARFRALARAALDFNWELFRAGYPGRANAPRMLKWARFVLIRTGWVVEKRPVFCSVISQTDNKC